MGYEHPVEIVDGLGLDGEQRDLVLHGTAAKLLKV
jgi:hypothetical protein